MCLLINRARFLDLAFALRVYAAIRSGYDTLRDLASRRNIHVAVGAQAELGGSSTSWV